MTTSDQPNMSDDAVKARIVDDLTRARRRTALLTESVGEKAAQEFARLQPGMVFTNDLVEEFTDLVDCFRLPLNALGQQLSKTAQRPPDGGS